MKANIRINYVFWKEGPLLPSGGLFSVIPFSK